MLKEVMKIKITENKMWFKICRALFHRKISCAKEIVKEIGCDPQEVRSRFVTLEDYGITKLTGVIPKNHLADKHRKGNYSKFYLLTETARKVMEEILRKEQEK